MRRLLHISLSFMATFAMFFIVGCSNEDFVFSPDNQREEMVQVRFSAALSQDASAGSDADTHPVSKAAGLQVVVCAVFADGREVSGLRETITVEEGKTVFYEPILVKNQTYDIVFWAMQDDAYHVEDMTNISRNAGKDESQYDAFSACIEEHKADGTIPETITLTRPLSRINLGVSEKDWAEAADNGRMPTRVEVRVAGAYSGYNAVAQSVAGEATTLVFSMPVSEGFFEVGGNTYRRLSSNYVLADGNVDFTYTLYVKNDVGETSFGNTITALPVSRNFNTNIVGDLLSGRWASGLNMSGNSNTME